MLPDKNKCLLSLSAILFFGFLLTSLISYYTSRASLRDEIRDNELPLTGDNIYSEIQRDLLKPIFIASLMANDTFLRDWVLQGEKNTQAVTRYLREIQDTYGTFTSFFVSEKTKKYYHSSGILKKIREDSPRDTWFFRVQNMTDEYEINVDVDMANNDALTIFINYKMFDYAHRFIGATGVGLRAHAVQKLINIYRQRYHRTIYFVDKQGALRLDDPTTQKHDTLSSIPAMAPFVQKIISSPSSSFSYKKEGDTIHVSTRFIPEFGWYLVVEQSEHEAIEEIHNALIFNLLACILITLAVLTVIRRIMTAYQNRIEKLATIDPLTGVYNRQPFDVLFDQAVNDHVRNDGSPFSLILLDIDRFKSINDTYGHLVGDTVLKRIAETLRSTVRASDAVFRWGGEEFLLLLRDCPVEDAFQRAESIRTLVMQTPAIDNDRSIQTTISLGVTGYRPDDTKRSMTSRADRAMYRAKQQGRNRTEIEQS